MNKTLNKLMLGLILSASVVIFSFTIAQADTLTGTYFKIPITHPDVQHGIDGSFVTGLVTSTLGPDGLPVASAFGKTYAGPSGPIHDLNASDEILWWSTSSPYGILFEKSQVDSLPLSSSSNFFPDGQSNDSTFMRAVHWQGTFNLASPGSVTFTLGADDDAWVYIDGQLKVDDGGVKGYASVPNVITGLSAGTHPVDVFFADRHTVQSALTFSADIALQPTPVPEPTTMVLLGSGLIGLAGYGRKKFFKK